MRESRVVSLDMHSESRSLPGAAPVVWRRAAALLLIALTTVLPRGTGAQEWTGSAAVGVEVRDEAGQPIEGAAVVLLPEGGSSDTAPPFVFTDASGQVEVPRLAEGEWQIEVRAPGYMIFNGYLKLAAEGPPSVGFTSRQRTGTFWEPLEVRFFQPGSEGEIRVAATEEGRKEEKRRRKQARKLRRQAEKAERRAAKREERRRQASGGAEVAVLKEPEEESEEATAAAEPTPTAAPAARIEPAAPEPPAAQRTADSQRPAAEPTTAEAPPSVQVAEAEPAPEPAPEPAAEPAPEPAAEPAPAADLPSPPDVPEPAVPPIQARPVLFHGGACPECKPGEWALVVEQRATPRRDETLEVCGSSRGDEVARLLQEAVEPHPSILARYAGPVADAWDNRLPAAVWESVPEELRAAWEAEDGACRDLIGVLPQGARFIGFRYEVAETDGREGDCFGTEPCAVGDARFTANPEIERTATATIVHASFFNASPSKERLARMTLYFRPPASWNP